MWPRARWRAGPGHHTRCATAPWKFMAGLSGQVWEDLPDKQTVLMGFHPGRNESRKRQVQGQRVGVDFE